MNIVLIQYPKSENLILANPSTVSKLRFCIEEILKKYTKNKTNVQFKLYESESITITIENKLFLNTDLPKESIKNEIIDLFCEKIGYDESILKIFI